MWQWLKNLFRKPDNPRGIFEFFDGSEARRVDPIEVWSKFQEATGEELDALLREASRPPTPGLIGAMAEKASIRQREAVRRLHVGIINAFSIQAYDGHSGLTASERVALAVQYLQFLSSLAGESRPTLASQPSTAVSLPS